MVLFYFWRDFCSNFCLLNQNLAAALSITFLVVERRIDLQNYCLLRSPCGRLKIFNIACRGVFVAAWRSLECWSKLASWQTASGTASVGRQRWYSSERPRVSKRRENDKILISAHSRRRIRAMKGKTIFHQSKGMRVTCSRHTTSNASFVQELAQILLRDVSWSISARHRL
jgi:hypothetical protein